MTNDNDKKENQMTNKTSNQAEFVFVKHITDRDGEIGELYKVGSEFFVVKWARDDADRKPCKHNTTFTEVWECNFRGTVGNVGRDPTYEWLRWHSGKSIMARFVKSRPSPAAVATADEAIRALQDVAESVDELEAECYRLRAELKTALAERDELRQQVETIKNGFEGGCYLCEVVGEMNKKLLAERDAARQDVRTADDHFGHALWREDSKA